jgi:hypothetical protein
MKNNRLRHQIVDMNKGVKLDKRSFWFMTKGSIPLSFDSQSPRSLIYLMLLFRSVVVWLLILVLAVLNGGFREVMLLPNIGRQGAFVLSGILLSLCIVIVAIVFARWLRLRGPSRCLFAGLIWLCLTLSFEFSFGLFVQKRPWAAMLEAYTFEDGNIWPLVLVVTFFAPLLAARIRGKT